MDELFQEMQQRYQAAAIPWDAVLPPPEVMDAAAHLAPGRALDLGCGTGRAAVYLAQHGWTVDAVDFVPEAISQANERAKAANVMAAIHFHTCSVTELDHLTMLYDLAIDVGCGHALHDTTLMAYAAQLLRLVRPGGLLLLFARLLVERVAGGPRGILEAELDAALGTGFRRQHVVYGTTTTDGTSWDSAWFWFVRMAEG